MRTKTWILSLAAAGTVLAADPPALINYQGVLRGANDKPLDGTYDMVFSFFDAASGGNQILVDAHDAAHGSAVTVAGGLFSIELGGGSVSDGSGPGTFTGLDQVFVALSNVFVEVRIGSETLAPRTRVVSAAYALNAGHAQVADQLSGSQSGFYLDTSSTWQTKSGALRLESPDAGHAAIDAVATTQVGAAGYFEHTPWTARTWVGYGNTPIAGYGWDAAYFENTAPAGPGVAWALRANGYLNDGALITGNNGRHYVEIAKDTTAIHCNDGPSTSDTRVCSNGFGIEAWGQVGGHFRSVWTGEAYLSYGDEGVHGYGNFGGGFFDDLDSSGWVRTGYSTYKVQGSGSVSFVQNHPYESDKVIVYAAPEGDEVAVYTRGTAKLAGGQARVALGETFALVADPDVGLTAYVTPVDEAVPLAVIDKSTTEIVVRGPAASTATFDYIVWGLRIGFDQQAIVQPKQVESPIPSMRDHEKTYNEHAALRRFNALERFKSMRPHGRSDEALDRSRGRHLLDAVGIYDPARHGSVESLHKLQKPTSTPRGAFGGPDDEATSAVSAAVPNPEGGAVTALPSRAPTPTPPARERGIDRPFVATARPAWLHVLQASGPIAAGEVVALDPEQPGRVKRADIGADADAIGIAVSASTDDTVEVAATIVEVRVDAGCGAIVPGDLLTSSPTPGAAMRMVEPGVGAIVGKALEPLETGIGTIRVLVGQPSTRAR
jgi:hypothetical protein